MALKNLHHIGIAVPDLPSAIVHFCALYGVDAADVTHIGPMPSHGVEVAFINIGTGPQLELLAPLGDSSPIAEFLARHPQGGQHHICFEVADLDETIADLTAKGAKVLGVPRIGAHGAPVVFVHPRDFNGVLIELMAETHP